MDVLQDLSDSSMVNAIEKNRYSLAPLYYNWPGAEGYTGKDLCWCITDIAFPACNAAFQARLNPERVEDVIETFIARGRAKKVPLHWWIGHDTRPADLGERLKAHGFIHSGDSAGMAIDLLGMNEDVPRLPALTIEPVKDIETLKIWVHITAVGFGIPVTVEPALLKWFATCIELKLPMKYYLGRWDGKPVSTSMLLMAAGVAGIYFVATVPEARRQGIGFAVTQQPLLEAREMGYRVGILQASKMGYPVYESLGFKEYCKFGVYLWTNRTAADKR
jgi:GNAT superfamily N-acetyltransferase